MSRGSSLRRAAGTSWCICCHASTASWSWIPHAESQVSHLPSKPNLGAREVHGKVRRRSGALRREDWQDDHFSSPWSCHSRRAARSSNSRRTARRISTPSLPAPSPSQALLSSSVQLHVVDLNQLYAVHLGPAAQSYGTVEEVSRWMYGSVDRLVPYL